MSWDKIDRRRALRIKFPFTIHLYPTGKSPISAYTEDLGAGGVKVTVHQELKISSIVELEVYVKLRPIVCKGKVVWINKRESEFLEGETFFDVGIEFQGLNSDEEEAITERLDRVIQSRRAKEGIDA